MVSPRLVRLTAACFGIAACLTAPRSADAAIDGSVLTATLPATGGSPRGVFATHAPGRPNEMFVVDQRGLVQVLNLASGSFASTPFLDIQSIVDDTANEQGLLGLAFAPDFATSGHFYVNYTYDPAGAGLDRTRVERYTVTNPATDLTVSVATRRSVLEFNQDFDNHNGGWIGFSPNDGLLYISAGDGGLGNDPNNRGQSLNTRLGKVLRVDPTVDDFPTNAAENFGVPSANPFASDGNANTLGEVWAYGLRNPWRASFDRANGDLWIGDVGQNTREEVDRQASGVGGANFGWRLREGDIQTPSVGGPIPPNYVAPVYDYLSDGAGQFGGNSVVGGYVYRGPDAELQGRYYFGDSFPSQLWWFNPSNPDGTVQNLDSLLNPSNQIGTPVSFAEDVAGNLYIVDLDGQLFRINTGFATQDYNLDGAIDGRDRDFWAFGYGSGGDLPDGNGDGVVDAADYTVWRDAAGAAGSSVPEPSCGAMLAALAVALATSPRRPPAA